MMLYCEMEQVGRAVGAWGWPSVGTKGKPLDEILGVGKDSEASDAIIRVVDRPDPRPVWVLVWGGSREVAQAIWKVRATRSPAELERFLGKLRILHQVAATQFCVELNRVWEERLNLGFGV